MYVCKYTTRYSELHVQYSSVGCIYQCICCIACNNNNLHMALQLLCYSLRPPPAIRRGAAELLLERVAIHMYIVHIHTHALVYTAGVCSCTCTAHASIMYVRMRCSTRYDVRARTYTQHDAYASKIAHKSQDDATAMCIVRTEAGTIIFSRQRLLLWMDLN